MVINGHLTSKIEHGEGDCISYVAHGALGWASRTVRTTIGLEGLGTTTTNGYSHKMLK